MGAGMPDTKVPAYTFDQLLFYRGLSLKRKADRIPEDTSKISNS
jgi:hypothetical protein